MTVMAQLCCYEEWGEGGGCVGSHVRRVDRRNVYRRHQSLLTHHSYSENVFYLVEWDREEEMLTFTGNIFPTS
jgi:hypothetical protein